MVTKAAELTRQKILQTALDLFNTRGTDPVSTNHIAEAVGISPGNLYYHFRNKAEIIRMLFERQFEETDRAFALAPDQALSVEAARALVRVNFEIIWRYRFIYREILPLLRADDALRTRYLAVRERGYAGFHEIFDALSAAGLLVNVDDAATVREIADLCWLISEFWLANVEVSGNMVAPEQIEHGLDLMMRVLRPYIPTLG